MQHEATVPAWDNVGLERARARLVESIARWTTATEHLCTAIPGLIFRRLETPTQPASYMHEPSVCLVAQGAKRVLLGEEAYDYDAYHFLITSVDLPVVAHVTEASPEKPYLSLTLRLDRREIAQLTVDSMLPPPRSLGAGRGMAVSELSLPLLKAFLRLIDLLDEPEDIPILAPLAQREICYRLLTGEQGPRLRQVAAAGGHGHQISGAIEWLKEHYAQSLRVDDLAARAGMSSSAFHHHFRALTAMSPLQFQKWLRLHEARRLMFSERLDAASASFQVGYESPSQFSREYSRLFGAPPLRDIKGLNRLSVEE